MSRTVKFACELRTAVRNGFGFNAQTHAPAHAGARETQRSVTTDSDEDQEGTVR